jgi:hypothetical protein
VAAKKFFQSMLKIRSSITRAIPCRFASSHSHGDHGPSKDILHKEEYLKVAREWPHEYFDPSHFEKGKTLPQKVTPEMLALMATAYEHPEPETFNRTFWTRVLVLGVLISGFYRTNEYLTKDGQLHPLTKFIGQYLTQFDGQLTYEEEKASIKERQQYAWDQLIFRDKVWKPVEVRRWSFPATFQRASDFIIPVGSQVDVRDVKMKHTWEKDDELMGKPYPN